MLDRVATDALRSRSPEKLEASIRDLLSGLDNAGLREDSRDLMVALAPLHDCARRIGLDPAAVFDAAAEGASPETAQLARARGGVRAPAGGGPGALARRLFGRDDVAMSLGVLLDRRHGPHVLLVELLMISRRAGRSSIGMAMSRTSHRVTCVPLSSGSNE